MRTITTSLLGDIQQELEKLTATGETLNSVKIQCSPASRILSRRLS